MEMNVSVRKKILQFERYKFVWHLDALKKEQTGKERGDSGAMHSKTGNKANRTRSSEKEGESASEKRKWVA